MADLSARPRLDGGPDHQIRAVLGTADINAVGYRLPVVELLPTADEDTVVGHLGPDLLGPDWDLEEALRRIASDPGRTIGEALLDQRNLAGIGTFYRSELLFLQGVHPRTPVADVANLPAWFCAGGSCCWPTDGGRSSPRLATYGRGDGPTCSSVRSSRAGAAARRSGLRSSARSVRSGAATGAPAASRCAS